MNTTGARIETLHVDTSRLPVTEQFDEWARHSGNSHASPLTRGGFRVRGDFWNLGPVVVTACELDPLKAERTSSLIAATPADHFIVGLILDGYTWFEGPGIAHGCRSGDVFLSDYTQPSLVRIERQTCILAYVARDFVEEMTGPIRAHGPLRRTVETAILADSLRSLSAHLPQSSRAYGGLYAQAFRNQLAAAIIGPFGSSAGRERWDLRDRAKAYIAAQPPGTLQVEKLIQAVGIGRSALYELFRRDGGVQAYDRKRRLRLFQRDISLAGQHLSLAEIGALHGFMDASGLTRTFRETFGMTPGEMRRQGWRNGPTRHDEAGMGRFREAVIKLTAS